MKENWGKYIMIVEGSIPLGNPGYCTIAGHSAKQVFDEAAHGASAIIAWGNCASSGCIQGAYPNPTDTKPVHKIISGKPVINVQGCYWYTPHDVAVRWMRDVMDVLQGYNIGYALWNFRGGFGILDSGRKDCAYEDWRGHKLDRQMLEVLQAH